MLPRRHRRDARTAATGPRTPEPALWVRIPHHAGDDRQWTLDLRAVEPPTQSLPFWVPHSFSREKEHSTTNHRTICAAIAPSASTGLSALLALLRGYTLQSVNAPTATAPPRTGLPRRLAAGSTTTAAERLRGRETVEGTAWRGEKRGGVQRVPEARASR
ncbi:hypothetical protein DFJ73DRAFT_779642 [Zopfochytrium polystomum]|nr:hypothetical protein DFJ73DRAFT_779642 [Zopfochytrium polystomum]